MMSDSLQGDAVAKELQKPRDFSIKVEDQTLHVHKSVLSAASDYFDAMLASDMKESDAGEICIQHTRADVVKTMIGYFYRKDVCTEWERIKDYVDIVELWQLAQVKHVLESYIAENIVLQDCIEWFSFADAYDMECVVLRIIKEFFNTHFLEISRSKEFLSLSLSSLISLISHKDVIHHVDVLEGCISWVEVDESSRKQELSVLLNTIRFNERNPAYLKQMLNTGNNSLFADQAIRAKIQEVIASLIILVGCRGRKVFCVNLASHTVTEIGKCPDDLSWPHACCTTDSGIFYGGGNSHHNSSQCGLLDLASFKVTNLPSLTVRTTSGSAAAIGSKIFVIDELRGSYSDSLACYLDLQDKQDTHWSMCPISQHLRLARLAVVDSLIFQIGIFWNRTIRPGFLAGNSVFLAGNSICQHCVHSKL